MKLSRKKILTTFAVVLTALVLFSFTGTRSERYFEIAKNLDIFATLFKEVNAYYVDEVNPNKLMRSGIESMLKTLDPYTNYIPEDDIEDYRTLTTGQYGGIGAIIGTRNGKNLVIMPYEGFPAHESGLKIGDEIVEVNGVDVSSKEYTDISKLLKGQANTDVNLKIKRFGEKDLLNIDLKRAKITIDNVPYHGMINDDIAYIRLSDFTMGAGKEVGQGLDTFIENPDETIKKALWQMYYQQSQFYKVNGFYSDNLMGFLIPKINECSFAPTIYVTPNSFEILAKSCDGNRTWTINQLAKIEVFSTQKD